MKSLDFKPYGERSVLIEFDFSPTKFLDQISKAFPEAHLRPGLKTVLLTFPNHFSNLAEVSDRFPTLREEDSATAAKTVTVQVTYDGEDLASAAAVAGITVTELIAIHQETPWRVALLGFAPGFPYLSPEKYKEVFEKISRISSPRAKVPQGSIGLAAGLSCIYPSASPGGWQLIGTTKTVLFDATSPEPALLQVGDQVKFEALP